MYYRIIASNNRLTKSANNDCRTTIFSFVKLKYVSLEQ